LDPPSGGRATLKGTPRTRQNIGRKRVTFQRTDTRHPMARLMYASDMFGLLAPVKFVHSV